MKDSEIKRGCLGSLRCGCWEVVGKRETDTLRYRRSSKMELLLLSQVLTSVEARIGVKSLAPKLALRGSGG